MKEQLIIQKFGPIKHVDLEIRKYNILIGGQGTGKSIIAKIFTIFNDIEFLVNPTIDSFNTCLKRYSIYNFLTGKTVIQYKCGENFDITYEKGRIEISNVSDKFQALISQFKRTFKQVEQLRILVHSIQDDLFNADNKVIDENKEKLAELKTEYHQIKQKSEVGDVSLKLLSKRKKYIPAERIIISTISNSLFSFLKNDISLPKYISEFGEYYENLKKTNDNYTFDFLNLTFGYEPDKGDYITLKNRKKIALSEAASGIQSIIPLLVAINDFTASSVVIEEPEINIFPYTQYELVKYAVKRFKELDDIFITTHSPYILSSFNNLMFAHQIGELKPRKVGQLIEKDLWVNPNEVVAYMMMQDGTAESIIDDETLQIKAEKIDEVSRDINAEYDKLLDIKYAKK